MSQLEALQNAANNIGAEIHQKYESDRRRTVTKFFAAINGCCVSPVLPYNELNAFLLGWIRCQKINDAPEK